MKKLLSIALALVLCLALCVPAFAATPDLGSFTDKIEEIKASLGDFDTAKITEALGNIDLDSIKDALSGSGIDLSEIAGLLGGGDFDLGAIKDQVDISAVKDALAKLGIDTSMLGDGSAATPSDPNKTDNANTNGGSNGAADDVEIPDTGNTGIDAIAALTMAAAAVVVLAKKKH